MIWGAVCRLMRWDRPVGALLLLWPTWWALWLASHGAPPASLVCIFTLGVWVMRSLGCVINDWADRHWDGLVERTAHRPLVQGLVTPRQVGAVVLVLLSVALILDSFLPRGAQWWSVVALALASWYPWVKRWSHGPQWVLGAAFSTSVPMAYTAVAGSVSWTGVCLWVANVLWVVAYDTVYARLDRADDIQVGIRSMAIWWGEHDIWWVGCLQTLFVIAWIGIGCLEQLGWGFWVLGALAAAVLLRSHRWMHASDRRLQYAAFARNNWVGWLLFLGVCAGTAHAAPTVWVSHRVVGMMVQSLAGPRWHVQISDVPSADPHMHGMGARAVQAVHRADWVVWLGPQREPHWASIVSQIPQDKRWQVCQVPDVGSVCAADPGFLAVPRVGHAVLDALGQALIERDPDGMSGYRQRVIAQQALWQAAARHMMSAMAPHRGRPYMVTHKAMGALAEHLGLRLRGVFMQTALDTPGVQQWSVLLQRIQEESIGCLWDPWGPHALLEGLVSRAPVRRAVLDVEGWHASDHNAWLIQLGDQLAACMACEGGEADPP